MRPCEVCGTPCNSKYSVCRESEDCRREYNRRSNVAYRRNNLERVRERARQASKNHPERKRAYRRANPEKVRRMDRERYWRNREQILRRTSERRRAASERARPEREARRQANRERARERKLQRRREYYRETAETQREWHREWYRNNRAAIRTYRREHYQANRDTELLRHSVYRRNNRAVIAARSRAYRQDNAARLRASRRARYQDEARIALRTTVDGRARLLFLGARSRARKKGIPFDLTMEWVESELARALEGGCPLLGIDITLHARGRLPSSPSLDRFRPELGYVQGNCWIISWAANVMKHDLPVDFFREVIANGTPDFLERILEADGTRFAVGGAVQ